MIIINNSNYINLRIPIFRIRIIFKLEYGTGLTAEGIKFIFI